MISQKTTEEEQFLPSNLLQDDDKKTSSSFKYSFDDKQSFAFSAPPILFGLGYSFQDQDNEFNDFNMPEFNFRQGIKAASKNGSQCFEDFYPPPTNSIRKLSLQNECYLEEQMTENSAQNYYNTLTPEEQLIHNLSQVCQWSRDQNGSRAVQNVFETGQEYTKQLLFSFIFKQNESLMRDRFGNYVFQKIFEKGTEKQKKKLFDTVKADFLKLSQHSYGCRVAQKAVEYIADKKEIQEQLIQEIYPSTILLIQNQNGNHVLQKCCEIFDSKALSKIASKLIQNLKSLAFHAFGCRVIQKYLENCRGQQSEQLILTSLLEMTFDLSQCQYGNYVMQHIVLNCKQHKWKALQIIYYNFACLSYNKYASNVIEKVIKTSELAYIDKLAQLAIDSPDKAPIWKLCNPEFIGKNVKRKKIDIKKKVKVKQSRNQQIAIWKACPDAIIKIQMRSLVKI